MKIELLNYLSCLSCKSTNWRHKITNQTSTEILDGILTCNKCGLEYQLKHGIVDTVINRPVEINVDETDGWVQFAEKEGWNNINKAYLNAIPFPLAKKLMPHDSLTYDRHCRNFFRTLSYLDLPGKRVLDLGAGRCWSTKYLAMQGAECVATDIMVAPNVGLETATHYIEEQPIYFERVRCDMNDLPFRNAVFDFVLGQGAVHHSLDMERTFLESSRVLSLGGFLVLTNEHCSNPIAKELCEVPGMPGIHEHCYRGYRIYRWLRKAGFGNFHIVTDVYFNKKNDYCYRMLSAFGRFHPIFVWLKLFIYGGVFNLIATKIK